MEAQDKANLIEALKLVRKVCHEHTLCRKCPLGLATGECIFERYMPEQININEEEENCWKAYIL